MTLHNSPIWQPQLGPQSLAATSPVDIVFYGGTRGGGKSDALVGRHIRGAEKHGQAWNGLVLRRKFKDFAELRRRWDELILKGLPAERIGGDQQTNYIRFKNGANVTMTAIMRLEMVDSYQGHQYTEISIDEAPNFPFIAQMVEKLKGCLRSPHGVPCRMFLTGNPGGPGASIIKVMFIEKGDLNVWHDDAGESHVFIRSTLADNPILNTKDPKYVNRLRSIKDPALRAAWLEGDWDVHVGQALNFTRAHHVIDPIPVPEHAPLYTTFDWGFGKPFSWGWWWIDGDGRLYRFAEWYGWDKVTPDVGCRLEDSAIAQGVLEREERMNLTGRQITRLAGPDCWNKKPDYKGGGQGPSTAEVFAAHGLYLTKGDPSRELKIRQFRERLRVPEDGSMPLLTVYSNCVHFIRTIPSLCLDETHPEDIDTDQEDHIYDEACHIVMFRTLKLEQSKQEIPPHAKRIDDMEAGRAGSMDEFEDWMVREHTPGEAKPWWEYQGQGEQRPVREIKIYHDLD